MYPVSIFQFSGQFLLPFCLVLCVPGTGRKQTSCYFACRFHWLVLAIRRTDGAGSAAACYFLLWDLHAHKSRMALLLPLLNVCMLYI